MPKVFILETDQPNAFATGRNPENSAVAVTRGLMRNCDSEELAGVIAHELAHIKHRDTLTMTITATLAGAIGFLSQFAFFFGMGRDNRNPLGLVGTLLIMILAPLAAMLVQMAISRTREYSADRTGAEIAGHPMWLARALQKIEQLARGVVNRDAERNPASAHLFIINPLAHGRGRQSVPDPSADRRAGAPPAADGGRRRRARRPRPLGLRLAPSTNAGMRAQAPAGTQSGLPAFHDQSFGICWERSTCLACLPPSSAPPPCPSARAPI